MTADYAEALGAPAARVRLLQMGDEDRGGNVLLLVGEGEDAQVLKLYRRRGTLWQEIARSLSHLLIEGKRGATSRARRDTEAACLRLWARHGFDVFGLRDAPVPSWVVHPALWMEYRPGRSLLWVLSDEAVPWEEKLGLLGRLAAEMRRRHALALELNEPLLIQEHGTVNHVLLAGARLIPFDFEVAYRASFPVLRAISIELGGYLRSMAKALHARFPEALDAFVRAYGDPALLRRIAEETARSGSLVARIRRRADRARRGEGSKADLMERLLATLDAAR